VSTKNTKLELTWVGKENRPQLEPRILLEDPSLSYHAQHKVSEGDLFDNKLIFGDNLLALKALEQEYSGKVKCIFIDPPYNTGSAFEFYDDGLEHSIWLGMIRDRLEILHGLLVEDGSIWITIDDNEVHYLKVLCDEVFGRRNFVAHLAWEKRTSRENRRVFSFNVDHILVFAKEKYLFDQKRNSLPLNEEVLSRYKNPDNHPRGPWQSVSANAQAGHATASQFYTLTLPSGREVEPPKGRCWLYTKEKMLDEIAKGNIWCGPNGDNAPRVKKFLVDSEDKGLTPETLWTALEVSTNDEAKKSLMALLPEVPVFDNPKPESLIERIIHIATNPGDLVLDSFGGSGTTGAVAHKMGRRWIMVELGEHCHTHIIPRLQKVIDGADQGGISKAVNWKGGGGFRYYKLAPSLMEQDGWGNWVISKDYNGAMLAEALCKLEGFRYDPSPEVFWMQGRSTERDFLYATTAHLGDGELTELNEKVGSERSLLVLSTAFEGDGSRWPNLLVRKIPSEVLDKCEWGHDDYSLKVENLPQSPVAEGTQISMFD
jgi:adenine-specific DNA-methyltransferase